MYVGVEVIYLKAKHQRENYYMKKQYLFLKVDKFNTKQRESSLR